MLSRHYRLPVQGMGCGGKMPHCYFLLTLRSSIPAILPNGVAVGAAGRHGWKVGGHAAHDYTPPGCQDAGRLWVKRGHLLVLSPEPVHDLVQVAPGVALEAGGVGHGTHRHLRGPHLLVDIAAIPTAAQVPERDAIALVEQGGRGGVLHQRDVVAGVVLAEDLFAEHDEEDDQGEDDKEDDCDANELFLAHVGVAGLDVGHHHGAEPAVLAHVARGAVAEEGAEHVDTGAAILTLLPLTLIDVLLTPSATKHTEAPPQHQNQ